MKRWDIAWVDSPSEAPTVERVANHKPVANHELVRLVSNGWEPFAVVGATAAHPERMWLRKRVPR